LVTNESGIGGTVPAMFTLCSEHVPVNRRGFYVTIVASYWMVVRSSSYALCYFLTYVLHKY
jgi:hypothetical protein